jgi:hypothetical protein
VIARTRQLDTQLDQQRRLSAERQGLERQLGDLQSRIDTPQRQVDQLQAEAQTRWQRARQRAEGRAFVVRLLFVGPLLALAIWQFRRFRGRDQWPAGAPGPDSLRECAAGTGAQPVPQL